MSFYQRLPVAGLIFSFLITAPSKLIDYLYMITDDQNAKRDILN